MWVKIIQVVSWHLAQLYSLKFYVCYPLIYLTCSYSSYDIHTHDCKYVSGVYIFV